MGDLSTHFSKKELACRDCGKCEVTSELIDALEALRSLGPEEIIVDDGYRCFEHNAAVGGVRSSQHLLGKAADIRIGKLSIQEMYARALKIPEFRGGGIGVYDNGFIHVDVRDTGEARWARVQGRYVGINELIEA